MLTFWPQICSPSYSCLGRISTEWSSYVSPSPISIKSKARDRQTDGQVAECRLLGTEGRVICCGISVTNGVARCSKCLVYNWREAQNCSVPSAWLAMPVIISWPPDVWRGISSCCSTPVVGSAICLIIDHTSLSVCDCVVHRVHVKKTNAKSKKVFTFKQPEYLCKKVFKYLKGK